jgi:hypothetical protein
VAPLGYHELERGAAVREGEVEGASGPLLGQGAPATLRPGPAASGIGSLDAATRCDHRRNGVKRLRGGVCGAHYARECGPAAMVRRMGVPDYETLMRPTLAALASGQPQTRGQLRDAVAASIGVTGDDLTEMLPSGKATVFGSRVGWALTYMSQAGLAARPKRGVYVITDRGFKVLDEQPDRIDNKVLEWLVENLPSPPVTRLLSDFLPTLPVRLKVDGKVHKPPKEARRLIANAVEQRNRVAHRGQLSLSTQGILDFLDAVQNTLYLLDYYCGNDWALGLVDSDYRARLGS